MHDIKNIINHLKEQAKKSMRKNGGELEPKMYFLILYPGQKTPVYFPLPIEPFFAGATTKAMLPHFAETAWLSKKASSPVGIQLLAVCVVSDSWQTIVPLEGLSDEEIEAATQKAGRPSKAANRREAIAFSVCYPDRAESALMFYKRIGAKIEYEETREAENHHSAITARLYPKNL